MRAVPVPRGFWGGYCRAVSPPPPPPSCRREVEGAILERPPLPGRLASRYAPPFHVSSGIEGGSTPHTGTVQPNSWLARTDRARAHAPHRARATRQLLAQTDRAHAHAPQRARARATRQPPAQTARAHAHAPPYRVRPDRAHRLLSPPARSAQPRLCPSEPRATGPRPTSGCPWDRPAQRPAVPMPLPTPHSVVARTPASRRPGFHSQ